MIRKIFLGLLALVVIGLIGFFTLGPAWIEGERNQIDGQPLIAVSDEAKALHKTLTIVDLHSDTLMWKRDMLDRAERGHMDLPRLQDGNVALQVFSSVTKSPRGQNYDANSADTDNITPLVIGQLQPVRTWNSLLERSLYQAQKLREAEAGSDGQLVSVDNQQDIDALLAERKTKAPDYVGALLSIEGLQNLEGDIDNLDVLYRAGFRMAGFTHFFDNELAGSMHGLERAG